MRKPKTVTTTEKPAKKPFDKSAWLDEKKAKIDNAKELLEVGLGALQTSDEWEAMLTSISRNVRNRFSPGRYSFGNQLLLAMQRDNVTSVATYNAWKKAGRTVIKGEKGLMILTPKPWEKEVKTATGTKKERGIFFGTAYVFDITQTDGKALPKPPAITVDVAEKDDFAHSIDKLREVVLALRKDEQPVCTSFEVRARRTDDPCRDAKGWYTPSDKSIVVIKQGSRSQQFKTAVHETAHALLHGSNERHTRPVEEVEAESTAFIVCSVLGLETDSYSFPYVAVWASRDNTAVSATEMVKRSGDRIMKAVNVILDALLGKVEDTADEETQEEQAA